MCNHRLKLFNREFTRSSITRIHHKQRSHIIIYNVCNYVFDDLSFNHLRRANHCNAFNLWIRKSIIAYIIDNNMGPLLVVYPSDGAAREFSVEKLEPMIAHNKFLRDKIYYVQSSAQA